jgi:hypothetical protein
MSKSSFVGALLAVTLVTGLGNADTTKHECLQGSRVARHQCIMGCMDTFRSDFATCFGGQPGGGGGGTGGGGSGGATCAATCLTTKLGCVAGPTAAIHACVWDPTNSQSCRAQLHTALTACATAADPQSCADDAKLAALKCRQACVDAQAPALLACQNAFKACLRTCGGGSPSGAFLD